MSAQAKYVLVFAVSLAALAIIAAGTADAENAPVPGTNGQTGSAPIKLPLVGTQNSWTKICGKDQAANKTVCYTTRDFGAAAGKPPVVALAVYDIAGDDTKLIRILMPTNLMLKPGFRFGIDGGAQATGAFDICFPKGCFADAKISSPTFSALKRGTTLNVSVRNQGNTEVIFNVPLEGFGKAVDGPAIDPKVLQDQQQKAQAAFQKDAEERRNKEKAVKPTAPTH